jgi:beta-lactamase class A
MYEQVDDNEQSDLFNQQFFLNRRDFLAALAATSAGALGLTGCSSSPDQAEDVSPFGTPARRPVRQRGYAQSKTAGSTALQHQVLKLLTIMTAKGMIGSDERSSWSVYDINAGKPLVAINRDTPRQTASMVKPLVAQAFFFNVKNSGGRVQYTEDVYRTMVSSIRHSSNSATNKLIDMVGNDPHDVEIVLKRNAPSIFKQTRIVEKIPASGRTFRNLASAGDYTRFLISLWHDRLPYSGELKKLMGLPNRDRITHGVDAMPSSVRVYDKTGSTSQLCGDMGIIDAPSRNGQRVPYVFVGIIERPNSASNYGAWIARRGNAIRAVSNLVYLDMKQRYHLV